MSKYAIDPIDLIGALEIPKNSFVKEIIWPFYCWQTIVPKKIEEDRPDILEQLYMSIKSLPGNLDPDHIFQELHIDPDLLRSVKKACLEEGLENVKRKDEERTIVYIFRDAVSGYSIPELSIERLPRDKRIQSDDLVALSPSKNPNYKKTPDPIDLSDLITKYVRYKQAKDDESSLNNINEENTFEDSKKERRLLNEIRIFDNKSELINIKLTLYVNAYEPDTIHIISPFPYVPNTFFDKIVSNTLDDDFLIYKEYIISDMKNEYKDKIAFDNPLNIPVIMNHPILSNNIQYKGLKEEIIKLYLSMKRIKDGSNDFDAIPLRCGKVLEYMLDASFNNFSNEEKIAAEKNIEYGALQIQIPDILNNLKQINYDQCIHLQAKELKKVFFGKNHYPRNVIIALAFMAIRYKGKGKKLFYENKTLVKDIIDLYGLRNRSAHMDNSGDNKLNYKVIESAYKKINILINDFTNEYLER